MKTQITLMFAFTQADYRLW